MRKQVIAVGINGAKIIVDKNSDPRNVQLFSKVDPKYILKEK